MRVVKSITFGLLIFWLICVGPFAWILKDGLGPSSVESSGIDVIWRFWRVFYWGPILMFLGGLVLFLELRTDQNGDSQRSKINIVWALVTAAFLSIALSIARFSP